MKKSNLKTFYLTIFIIFTNSSLFAQLTIRQERNLTAFTKLYGYVRFFYPSDEAQLINWYRFANYGSIKVLDAKNDTDLQEQLKQLFIPFASDVKIYIASSPELIKANPPFNDSLRVISWQHIGVQLIANEKTYKSIRLGRTSKDDNDSLFSKHVNVNDMEDKELVKGIWCSFPLALYGNKYHTFPIEDTAQLTSLNLRMSAALIRDGNGQVIDSGDILGIRFCDIIVTWNVLKHLFPYWSDASQSPDEILKHALRKAYLDKNSLDFLATLEQLAAPLNDGHMFVSLYQNKDINNLASAPICFTKVSNHLVVKFVMNEKLRTKLYSGDIIKTIDSQPALEYLRTKEDLISGSTQWKQAKALFTIANGAPGRKLNIIIYHRGRKIRLAIPFSEPPVVYRPGNFSLNPMPAGWIKPGIFYINLINDSISTHIPDLLKAKAIIFDVRGYPKQESFKLISMLLKEKENTDWAFFPQILYPDYNKVTYQKEGWHLEPDQQHITAKVYFLSDATAISAAESLLGYVKDFGLGEIIGQPTAGTNGNINTIYLLGDYSIGFTGMVVKNHDGTKHHLNGIIPDIEIEPSRVDIAKQRDRQLIKALRVATVGLSDKAK